MRTCILALTEKGATLAARIRNVMGKADVFLPEKGRAWNLGDDYFPRLSAVVPKVFPAYDALVFIMATGIVVRQIAPFLQGKLADPAVLVFDEGGRHGISLLSGHVGGANGLVQEICRAIGSDPVITTATDVGHLEAPDLVLPRIGLFPVPKKEIQTVNTLLLRGMDVPIYLMQDMRHADFYRQKLGERQIPFHEIGKGGDLTPSPAVILAQSAGRQEEGRLYFVPRTLIAGIGCRKGTSAAEVLDALGEACQEAGLSIDRIDRMASTVVKEHEQGLLQAADKLDVPLVFYDNETLGTIIRQHHLEESPFVKKTIGIGNVCEAAALAAAGSCGGRFALMKTKKKKVTVALLWQNLEN